MRPLTPILFIALALAAGCKKHYPLAADIRLVKSQFISTQNMTWYYWYDVQGRLTKDSSNNNSDNYAYTDTLIADTQKSGPGSQIITFFLNSQGLVDSDLNYNKYLYNELGQLTEKIQWADTTFYTWSDGDNTVISEHSPAGISATTYTYSTTYDNRNFGQPYFGKGSLHLLTSRDITQTYSYTFDALGRVSSMAVITGANVNSISVYTYY